VLTRDREWSAEGADVAHGVEEALELAGAGLVSIIGGAEIYRLFLDRADAVELTEVHADPVGDTIMPPFDPSAWSEEVRVDHPADGDTPAYSFVRLERR
jgi:dihydrofolate reductase